MNRPTRLIERFRCLGKLFCGAVARKGALGSGGLFRPYSVDIKRLTPLESLNEEQVCRLFRSNNFSSLECIVREQGLNGTTALV